MVSLESRLEKAARAHVVWPEDSPAGVLAAAIQLSLREIARNEPRVIRRER